MKSILFPLTACCFVLFSLQVSSLQISKKMFPDSPVALNFPLLCATKPACPRNPPKLYNFDGSCNNLVDGSRGQAGRAHKRLLPPAYGDERGSPRKSVTGNSLPSARAISRGMVSFFPRRSFKHTHMIAIFGQFLSHDITHTSITTKNNAESNSTSKSINCFCGSPDPDCINIPIPSGDIQNVREGKTCFPLVRSKPVQDNNCSSTVREQQNSITPYLDAGVIYGSSRYYFEQLLNQSSTIGELKTGNLFPFGHSPNNAPSLPLLGQDRKTDLEMDCPLKIRKPAGAPCFAAGDSRANENPALTSLHTIFARLHNKIVRDLNRINSGWSKQKLIDTARFIVAAILQRISYNEYLPEILSRSHLKQFNISLSNTGYSSGYDPTIDATISNEFATAALRFGHTLVTSPLTRQTPQWTQQGQSMPLKNSFFDSTSLLRTNLGGANSVLRGLCSDQAESMDSTLKIDLFNFMFAKQGQFGNDLLATNIQRGRDHGIPGYNAYREFCGLQRAETIDDFHEIPVFQRRKLKKIYANQVDDVDLYIAGLSETPVEGGLLGATFSCILSHQFRDIKNGDRLWHENGGNFTVFDPAQLRAIRNYSFARLICDTASDTQTIQPNPFQQPIETNKRRRCSSFSQLDLNPWRELDEGTEMN